MKNKSLLFLVLANLVPLFGLVFLSWDLFAIIFFYWAENIVIGFYNVVKIITTAVYEKNKKTKNQPTVIQYAFITGLFTFHYGMFTFVHGLFIGALFGPSNISINILITSIIFLFVSHGASYLINFIGKEEYKKISVGTLFTQPYKRIVVVHLTIIFGGGVAKILGIPIWSLVVMILLKILLDASAHTKEHENLLPSTISLKNLFARN